MICTQCGKGDLVPTLVPRIAGGSARIAYIAAVSGVLILGATIGLGLAFMGEGGVDWGRALVVVPMTLIACTPLVIFGAFRMLSEKEVLRCTSCQRMFDRALVEGLSRPAT